MDEKAVTAMVLGAAHTMLARIGGETRYPVVCHMAQVLLAASEGEWGVARARLESAALSAKVPP